MDVLKTVNYIETENLYMEKINIKDIETAEILYEGYLWLSNSSKPRVYDNQVIDIDLGVGMMPFVVEGQLYDRKRKVSYSIKYVDGEHLVNKYKDIDDETTDANIEHKTYLPNRMEIIGNRRLHFLRYWEPKEDKNCEDMSVLVITKNVFAGFKK